jgi:hypothetical protein
MFVKEVLGSELREGDIIRRNEEPFTIRRLKRAPGSSVFSVSDGTLTDHHWDNSRFLLIHRPWPEGVASSDILAVVADAAGRVQGLFHRLTTQTTMADAFPEAQPEAVAFANAVAELREAMDAYELGRFDREPSTLPDSMRAESDDNPLHRSRVQGTDGAW